MACDVVRNGDIVAALPDSLVDKIGISVESILLPVLIFVLISDENVTGENCEDIVDVEKLVSGPIV